MRVDVIEWKEGCVGKGMSVENGKWIGEGIKGPGGTDQLGSW